MDLTERRLQYLIDRYYHGNASREETQELMDLVRAGRYDALLEDYFKTNFMEQTGNETLFPEEKSNAMLNAILNAASQQAAPEKKVIRLNWLRFAAAAMLVLTGLGIWYNAQNSLKE
ncbi:hypothetical protein, partial [Dyadobacter sp.]|uniref:hypothetical protein n=1 Tax=Dyadobacter sp. TaxID=1914288 RepID=UPI003F6E74D6